MSQTTDIPGTSETTWLDIANTFAASLPGLFQIGAKKDNESNAQPDQSPQPVKNNNMWVIGGVALLVVVLIMIVVFALKKSK